MKYGSVLSFIPVEKLKVDEGPFSPLPPERFQKLKESIKKYGLIYPLVVTRDHEEKDKYLVRDGRNRFRALVEMGYEEIPCHVLDIDYPHAYILSYETELFRRHLTEADLSRGIEERTRLEKEMIREYKRRIMDNIGEFIPKESPIREAIKEAISDLSVLIELYHLSERFSQVAPELRKKIFSEMSEKVAFHLREKDPQVAKEIEREIEKIQQERNSYRARIKELENEIRVLKEERRRIEQNFKKIKEEIENRVKEQIAQKLMDADDRARAVAKEYENLLKERIAREEVKTRQKIHELTSMIDALKKELEELREGKRHLEEEKKALINERERLKRLIDDLKKTCARITTPETAISELNALKKRIEALKETLAHIPGDGLDEKRPLLERSWSEVSGAFSELKREMSRLLH